MPQDWTVEQWAELASWAEASGGLLDRDLRFTVAFLDLLERGDPIAQTHREHAARIWDTYREVSQTPETLPLMRWLRTLPRPIWFAVWDITPTPGTAHCVEVRLSESTITLRATGNQHTDSAHQLSGTQLNALEALGWVGAVDYRRRLRYPDLDASDPRAAADVIERTLDIYGMSNLALEVPPEIEGLLPATLTRTVGA